MIKLKAQITTEYAVVLAIVAAALLAMQVYMKRGIQGRIRDLADQLSPTQYEKSSTVSNSTVIQSGNTILSYKYGAASIQSNETINKRSNETIGPETELVNQRIK